MKKFIIGLLRIIGIIIISIAIIVGSFMVFPIMLFVANYFEDIPELLPTIIAILISLFAIFSLYWIIKGMNEPSSGEECYYSEYSYGPRGGRYRYSSSGRSKIYVTRS